MAVPSGIYTSGDKVLRPLYNEMLRRVEIGNATPNPFRAMLCQDTKKLTVRITFQRQEFRLASEAAAPNQEKHDWEDMTLNPLKYYELGSAVTTIAMETGMQVEELRDLGIDALRADFRLQQKLVAAEIFDANSFYDGALTTAPPPYKAQTFDTTHNHYLWSAAGGVPTLAMISEMKHHLVEHGYGVEGGRLVCFINSATAEVMEGLAPWNTTANYINTDTIEFLQKNGLWPSGVSAAQMQAVGIPIVIEDWIPEAYLVMLDLNVPDKMCRWGLPDTDPRLGIDTRGLILETNSDKFKWLVTNYRRHGAVTVVHRGAGCIYDLTTAHGTYTAPTCYAIT